MLFSNIGLVGEDLTFTLDSFVATQGNRIVYVGQTRPEGTFGREYDGRGKLLMPGMVNAHCHAPMTLLRGYAENLALDDWLNKLVFPFEDRMTDEEVYPATLLAIAEMLRFGTTSFSDMYFFNDARIRAVLESGIKCNLCNTVADLDDTPYEKHRACAEDARLISQYHGASDGRLLIDMGMHAEYTSNPTIVRTFAEAAAEAGVIVQVHVSETRKEVEECRARHNGKTPPAYFAELGLFDSPTIAAHCVWLEPDDFDILARHGVTVASNPVSNAKLGSGIANIPRMREAGVKLALGTDGPASNNSLNMFEDMKSLAMMSRARFYDPVGISPEDTLFAATRAGALAQGRTDTGLIAEGAAADLTVLDVDNPWMTPTTNMVNNLVYSAQGSDVVLTMVDGEVLYEDGTWPTIDVERAIADTQAGFDRVISQL